MHQFQKDLDIVDDTDPALLLIAWKLRCEIVWEISLEEFYNGFTIFGCSSMDHIKKKIKQWKSELHDPQSFRNFYNFVFDYLKEDKKYLLTDVAIVSWQIVLKDRPWKLFPAFEKFLNETKVKSISRDVWQQLWHFINAYPKNFDEYDENSSWPLLYDDFIAYEKERKKHT